MRLNVYGVKSKELLNKQIIWGTYSDVQQKRSERPSDTGVDKNIFSDLKSVDRKDDNLQSSYTTKEVVSRIWREHLRPRMKLLIIAGVAMLLTAATTGAIPLLIQKAADDLFVNRNLEMLNTITIAVIVVTVFKAIAEYVGKITIVYLGHRFIADLRIRMFQHLARADLSWIEDVHSGRFLSSFLNDANRIRNTASRTIVGLGENLAKVIILSGVMIWMDWRLASLILICTPVGVLMLRRQRRKMHKSTKKSLQETGDLSALVTQMLRGIRIVRAYGQEENEISRATNVINRTLEFNMRGARAQAIASPAVEILTGIGFAAAIYYAGTQGLSGRVSFGHFVGFMAAAMLIYQPLKSVATLQTAVQEGVAAASRVFGIIDKHIQQVEIENPPPLKIAKGEIVFDNVSFGYVPGQEILKDLTLTIPAGKTVALVGPSGAGKSTVFNLALRFFTPHKGTILIDGQDITQVTMESLRKSIALVTQDPVLFDDTIRANICYGSEDASPAKIEEAARAAAADEFINALRDGYDTGVGEAGISLSGGERQRIAIARALLKNAPILLLDEPTSSLDSKAEAKVQHALEKLMEGRTVLMIAHRLSTVKQADLIYVIDDGAIVETGRHEDLLRSGGHYARLYLTQFDITPPEDPAARKGLEDEEQIPEKTVTG